MRDLDYLRQVVVWADQQLEDHWYPPDRTHVSAGQVCALYDLCGDHGVEGPEDLPKPVLAAWRMRVRGV